MTIRYRKLDHVAIAVKDLEAAVHTFRDVLGLPTEIGETVDEQGVRTAFVDAGNVVLELICPVTPDSPVGRSIEKRGEGLHHVCLQVEDIDDALAELKDKDVRLVDEKPRRGAHHARIAFVHPKSVHGVLVELSQKADA